MKSKAKDKAKRSGGKNIIIVIAGVLLAAALAAAWCLRPKNNEGVESFRAKAELLHEKAFAEWTSKEHEDAPAGSAGFAVFFSVSDGTARADIRCGTGETMDAAWSSAIQKTEKVLRDMDSAPRWVKVDMLYTAEEKTGSELKNEVKKSRSGFYRYGIAFDESFDTALLEQELNGAKIYDYDNGGIDLNSLNTYLQKAGRKTLTTLPEKYTAFQCIGWLCDEDDTVYRLESSGLNYGRRKVEAVDADYARQLIENASDFLVSQIKDDGSFIYGWYPRFDNEIENYNMVRHAGTIWSLLCRYRMEPNEELASAIRKTIEYMLTQMLYDEDGRAYLYEKKDDEIKLGASAVAVVAMSEYMDVFGTDEYKDVCIALGHGILSMFDADTGCYYHVLNGDFSRKEETRTVYYDGEATFALCKLYGLTGDEKWLSAADAAVSHFIAADYTQYKDHWVAYAMNEITKYEPGRIDYYIFAMQNAQVNLKEIKGRKAPYPIDLELLMATFEVYDRAAQAGVYITSLDLNEFFDTVQTRVDVQLNGYFYPEVAMYMRNPERILNTFMVRHDGYRVRIDDVQHNIGGYYLYWKNYDKLLTYGMVAGK